MIGVPFSQLLISLCLDSANPFVLLLIGGGVIGNRHRLTQGIVLPFLFAFLLACGLWCLLPTWAMPRSYLYFLVLWVLLLGFDGGIGFLNRLSNPPSPNLPQTLENKAKKGWDRFRPSGLFLLLFCIELASLVFFRGEKQWVDWPWQNGLATFLALFYSVYRFSPWRMLPLTVQRDIRKLCFYLALGLFAFNASIWIYTAFNAAVQGPAGSIRLKGLVFATEYAQAWNFHRLEQLIHAYWYYPKPAVSAEEVGIEPDQFMLFEEGLAEADSFRYSLLNPLNPNTLPADRIAQAILRFQELAKPALQGRPALDGFQIDESQFVEQIQSRAGNISGFPAFEPFCGKWYGQWDTLQVDPDWSPLKIFSQPPILPGRNQMFLKVLQSGRIGDGFGWHVVISPDGSAEGDALLGLVCRIEAGDPKKICTRRPHVGVFVEKGRLIWITPEEIFLEAVLETEEQYVITGFRYRFDQDRLVNNGDAFQAVYTRKPDQRPAWYHFALDLHVP